MPKGDKEKPIVSALDDANAMQEKIRARVRWLTDQLSGKDLRAAEPWLAEVIRATEVTQAALKEIRRLEHERPTKEAERKQRETRDLEEIIAQSL